MIGASPRRCASTLLLAAALAAAAAAAEGPASLVIEHDGARWLGTLEVVDTDVQLATAHGSLKIPLDRVAEIIGPHAELVTVSVQQKIKHRTPDVSELMNRAIRVRLSGDPEGLSVILEDERWQIYAVEGKSAKKDARELLTHLAGIINRMKAFFPKGAKPKLPCKVRVFDDSPSFLKWRNRGQGISKLELLQQAFQGFYVADDAAMLADLRSFGAPVADKTEEFKSAMAQLLTGASTPQELIETQLLLTALAVACAQGDAKKVKSFLGDLLRRERDAPTAAGGAGAKPMSLPSADPSEGGEATFINYGYYTSTTNELVVWRSDQFWSTLSHEAFHYWLNENCPGAPIWINEGFATYFETFSPRQRKKNQGFHFDRYDELQGWKDIVPLETLLVMPIEQWQGQEGPLQSFLYAESWVFIHYLLNDDQWTLSNKGEKLLKGYLNSLVEGKSPREALDEHFTGDRSPESLQAKFLYYIQRLKRPEE